MPHCSHCFPVGFRIKKGRGGVIYENTKNESWERYDGGTRRLSARMIKERLLLSQQNEGKPTPPAVEGLGLPPPLQPVGMDRAAVQQIIQQALDRQALKQSKDNTLAGGERSASGIMMDPQLVEQLGRMGFDQGKALQTIYQMSQGGGGEPLSLQAVVDRLLATASPLPKSRSRTDGGD